MKRDLFVSKKPISLYEAIKVVHESKGIAVIAHLGEYHFSVDEKRYLSKIVLIMVLMVLNVIIH
ncbi:hypothetical protein SD457_25510 [Coprobacillaceae bacterium CR2/5/TPMF4]|nr:hypothetical protein SD457_25510 [Coprobacillaceae bacterium CR2/5/TPMF4]